MDGMLLKQIAGEVFMADHSSVIYHLDGRCKCTPPNGGCNHDWVCKSCGAQT